METSLATITEAPVTVERTASVAELKANVQLVQQCLRGVMKKGTHYDALPGCGNKPVLLKPGAEVILTAFRISAEPTIEEFTDGYDIRYRITVKGVHIPTDTVVGYGVGECSTAEKKYAWRAAVCHEEFEETMETRRQVCWKKGYKGSAATREEQVRQNPADIANTVLKMAKKRALVDLCLTATACSDIFTQDLEDDPESYQQQEPEQRYQAPQRKAQAPAPAPAPQPAPAPAPSGNVISDAQRKCLYAIGKGKGMTNEDMASVVFEIAGVERSGDIPRDLYEDVCAAFENFMPGEA